MSGLAAHEAGGGEHTHCGHDGQAQAGDAGGSSGDGDEVEGNAEQQAEARAGYGGAEESADGEGIEGEKHCGEGGHDGELAGMAGDETEGGWQWALLAFAGEDGLVDGGVEEAEQDGGAGVEGGAEGAGEVGAEGGGGVGAECAEGFSLHESNALGLGPVGGFRMLSEEALVARVAELVLDCGERLVLDAAGDFGGGVEVEVLGGDGGETGEPGFEAVTELPQGEPGQDAE